MARTTPACGKQFVNGPYDVKNGRIEDAMT